jgi:hypothetical protein
MEHLFYFNEKSIKILLEKSGFENIKIIKNYKILSFDYIYKHFMRFPVLGLSPLVKYFRTITPDRIANKHFKIVASGMALVAGKH